MHGSNVEMCIKNVSLHSELNLKIIRIEQTNWMQNCNLTMKVKKLS